MPLAPPSPTAASFQLSAQRNSVGSGPNLSHHQRHSSTSSISSHISPNLFSAGSSRRVWVKKPGSSATTVLVKDGDIVDDLKCSILNKYPTSLARTCDPADLILKIAKDDSEILLQPDELVFRLLDQYFPNGMSMNDALVLEQPDAVISSISAIPTPSRQNSIPASIDSPKAPLFTVQEQDEHMVSTAVNVSSPPPPPPPPPPSSFASSTLSVNAPTTATAKSETPANTTSFRPSLHPSTSAGSNSSLKANSPNNGVLLLPRQFQLPKGSPGSDSSSGQQQKKTSVSSSSPEQPKQADSKIIVTKPTDNESKENGESGLKSPDQDTKKKFDELVKPNNDASKNSSDNNENNENAPKKNALSENQVFGRQRKGSGSNYSITNIESVVPQVNVLIVEDNVINQRILEQFMRRKKIRSEVAKNGEEAVEKWKRGGFHLVLMDIQLPIMSGLEATKEIRRLEHVNRIGVFSAAEQATPTNVEGEDLLDHNNFRSPVIIVALTANSSSADKSEALAAGCNDFLTKPVNLGWLEQKTIEWGCMQALIDFEGWKKWVGRDGTIGSKRRTRSRSNSKRLQPLVKGHRSSPSPLTQGDGLISPKSPLTRGRPTVAE